TRSAATPCSCRPSVSNPWKSGPRKPCASCSQRAWGLPTNPGDGPADGGSRCVNLRHRHRIRFIRSSVRQCLSCRTRRPFHAAANGHNNTRRADMLGWTLLFLVVAIVAGVLGFGGIAGTAVGIAKILFFVFLVLFVVSLVLGRRGPRA